MDVTVVVATYGDQFWADLARTRAIPSVCDAPTIHVHGQSLRQARNLGLVRVDTEFVCFLDADDELEPGYFDAIDRSQADLRAPSVRYVTEKRTPSPRMPRVAGSNHEFHDCTAGCLAYGNWLVIGTVAPTQMLRDVGGFRDFDWSEDWDLWVRCWQAGASIEAVPDAVYRAHVRADSRNRAPERAVKHAQHQAIARANGLPVPA